MGDPYGCISCWEEVLLSYIGKRHSKRDRDHSKAMDSAWNADETPVTKDAAIKTGINLGQES